MYISKCFNQNLNQKLTTFSVDYENDVMYRRVINLTFT